MKARPTFLCVYSEYSSGQTAGKSFFSSLPRSREGLRCVSVCKLRGVRAALQDVKLLMNNRRKVLT